LAIRIGIDLLYIMPSVASGGHTYASRLLGALAEIDRKNEYFIFVNSDAAAWPLPQQDNFHRVVCPVSGMSRARRYAWEQFALPAALRSHSVDVCHGMGNIAPILARCPKVVTIHDVNYARPRNFMPARRKRALRFFCRRSAALARRIITVSHFSRDEIVQNMRVPADRVSVIHEGPGWVRNGEPEGLDALRLRYNLPEHYIVAFTGGDQPHKNVDRLISGFEIAREGLPHKLVLIGEVPPFISHRIQASPAIQALGYVPNEDIRGLLCRSDLFVLASLYEGFGLPLVEAQRSGAPAACSCIGALMEIAADTAAYFDPYRIDDIASVLRSLLMSPDRRADLIRRGAENSQRFSWAKAAKETLAIYESAAASGQVSDLDGRFQ
jgi:glycosyltransferase involved in cell wall biosynthesis